MTMPIARPLGRSGLATAPLVFGGNVFGWTVDQRGSFALLDQFVAAGFNCIDTADVYSNFAPGNVGGESETVIGAWLANGAPRDSVVIATKVGLKMGEGRSGLSRRWIVAAVEDSLRRLQTDYIDLYQSHAADRHTPIDETLRAYDELIASGKVRAIGASNYTAAQLREALDAGAQGGLARYETLQPRYNLYDRSAFEADLQPLCVAEGIGVIPYFSLASGFLTGKYRSAADVAGKARAGLVQNYLDDRGLAILAALDTVAAECAATPAQVALAWLNHRPGITAPIASASTPAQLEELLAGATMPLTPDQIAALDAASA